MFWGFFIFWLIGFRVAFGQQCADSSELQGSVISTNYQLSGRDSATLGKPFLTNSDTIYWGGWTNHSDSSQAAIIMVTDLALQTLNITEFSVIPNEHSYEMNEDRSMFYLQALGSNTFYQITTATMLVSNAVQVASASMDERSRIFVKEGILYFSTIDGARSIYCKWNTATLNSD